MRRVQNFSYPRNMAEIMFLNQIAPEYRDRCLHLIKRMKEEAILNWLEDQGYTQSPEPPPVQAQPRTVARPSRPGSMELVKIEFHGQEIEAMEKDGRVWVVVKRVCENLGIDHRSQRKKIQGNPAFEDLRGDITLQVPSGAKTAFAVDLDAFTLWLGSISAAKVKKEVRDILIAYQREAMQVLREHFFPSLSQPQTQAAPAPVVSQEDGLAVYDDNDEIETMLRAMLDHRTQIRELRVISQENREKADEALATATTAQVTATQADEKATTAIVRLDQWEKEKAVAARRLMQFPSPEELGVEEDVPERPLRSCLGELVRAHAYTSARGFDEVWRELYREFRDRYGVDLRARARNRNAKPLDVAEEEGLMEALYALAHSLYAPVSYLPAD